MTTMNSVGLFGSAWQCADPSIASPVIFGDVRRDLSTVIGIRVGVTTRSVSKHFNSHDVTADPDSVVVQRAKGEPFYDGLDPSLVQRVATQCGTSRAWSLEYR